MTDQEIDKMNEETAAMNAKTAAMNAKEIERMRLDMIKYLSEMTKEEYIESQKPDLYIEISEAKEALKSSGLDEDEVFRLKMIISSSEHELKDLQAIIHYEDELSIQKTVDKYKLEILGTEANVANMRVMLAKEETELAIMKEKLLFEQDRLG